VHTESMTTRRLVDLTADECWELAATRPVGRLVWSGPQGPTAVPVNFIVDGESVRARTAAYTAAARECDDSVVAFQVDQIGDEGHTGWSVLFRGRAHLEYATAPEAPQAESWLSSPRNLGLRIDVTEVTGRRLVGD
jgi:hypothetical protein